MGVARFFRSAPDGSVLWFRTGELGYEVLRTTLGPVNPPRTVRRAGSPSTALSGARSALCAAVSVNSVRAALESALFASALDAQESRRLELDLDAFTAGAPAAQLCALWQARDALAAGDLARARGVVGQLSHPALLDRRLFVEAKALERAGDLAGALHRYQRVVLNHADSPLFAEARDAEVRIADSGKLPGTQQK